MKAYKIKLKLKKEQKIKYNEYFGVYRYMYNKIISLFNKNSYKDENDKFQLKE